MFKTSIAAAALTLLSPAHAYVVVQWDFQSPFADVMNSRESPRIAASTGSGTASGAHVSADTDWTTPVGNGSSDSFSSNGWDSGGEFEFEFATTGFRDLVVSFDQTRSNTGPANFHLMYSHSRPGGIRTFASLATYTVAAETWTAGTYNPASTFTFDLAAWGTLNNSPYVALQLVASSGQGAAPGGTSRIDNFTVTSAVPEAGTAAMLAAGLAALGFAARRRLAIA